MTAKTSSRSSRPCVNWASSRWKPAPTASRSTRTLRKSLEPCPGHPGGAFSYGRQHRLRFDRRVDGARHQHLECARMDLEVDLVVELDQLAVDNSYRPVLLARNADGD